MMQFCTFESARSVEVATKRWIASQPEKLEVLGAPLRPLTPSRIRPLRIVKSRTSIRQGGKLELATRLAISVSVMRIVAVPSPPPSATGAHERTKGLPAVPLGIAVPLESLGIPS